jgi:hypothetical protein
MPRAIAIIGVAGRALRAHARAGMLTRQAAFVRSEGDGASARAVEQINSDLEACVVGSLRLQSGPGEAYVVGRYLRLNVAAGEVYRRDARHSICFSDEHGRPVCGSS